MPAFNPERAASALVDAVYQGDRAAAAKWGVTEQSIRNWRKRLEDDPIFYAFFTKKKDSFEAQWENLLPEAILAAIGFLKKAALEADHTNPDIIHSIAGAYKLLADSATAKRILDARLLNANAGQSQEH